MKKKKKFTEKKLEENWKTIFRAPTLKDKFTEEVRKGKKLSTKQHFLELGDVTFLSEGCSEHPDCCRKLSEYQEKPKKQKSNTAKETKHNVNLP